MTENDFVTMAQSCWNIFAGGGGRRVGHDTFEEPTVNDFSHFVEGNPQSHLRAKDLRGWPFFASVQAGVTICIPVFVLGILLGQHMALAELVPAIFVGTLVVALLATATGYVGQRTRVPTALILQSTFGATASRLVIALMITSSVGWFSVQVEMLVKSLNDFLATSGFATIAPWIAKLVAGGLMTTTAVIGYRVLGKIAYAAVPLLLIIVCVPIWTGLHGRAIAQIVTRAPELDKYSFGLVVSIVSGNFITGTTLCPDLTRFLRTGKDTAIGAFASLGLCYGLMLSLSAILGVIYASADIIQIMARAGLVVTAMIVLAMATWTSNDKNVYEASLSLSVLFPRFQRWRVTVFGGALGTVLSLVGIYDHFISVLLFLGIFVAPLAGVYVVDFLIRPGRYLTGETVRFRLMPFVAWGFGSAVGFLTLPKDADGLGLISLTNVPTLDALLSAGLFHLLIQRALGVRIGGFARAS
jgi:cytosine permease